MELMHDGFDVVIAGAGPAGASLAVRLGRAGWRVALLDRKRFPRPKPCGEFLSPECLPILDDLQIGDQLVRLGARRVAGMRIHGYGRSAIGMYRRIGRSDPVFPYGVAVQRELLDDALVRRAERDPNVVFLEGWRRCGLLRDGPRVVGVEARDPDGRPHLLRAPWTVAADGVRSTLARDLGVQHRVGWLDKFALTTHFAGVPELDTAELHVFPGGYFAAAPVGDDRFSVNLVVDRDRLRDHDGGWDAFFSNYLARVPELQERMQSARRIAPVRGTGPLAHRTSRQTFDGAVLVGDACGYVDPMTGEGIYFALRGAECLADELDAALHARTTAARALRGYLRARRREIGPRLLLSKGLQRGLRHPGIARTILGMLQRRSGIADLLVSLTGDYVPLRELGRPSVWRTALLGGTA